MFVGYNLKIMIITSKRWHFFLDTQRLIILSSSSTGHFICVFIVSMAYRQILNISQLLDNMSCSIFIIVIFWWVISENGGWITNAIHVGGWHSHLLLMDLFIFHAASFGDNTNPKIGEIYHLRIPSNWSSWHSFSSML